MTGFEPRTSGVGATALPTAPQPLPRSTFFSNHFCVAQCQTKSMLWIRSQVAANCVNAYQCDQWPILKTFYACKLRVWKKLPIL